MNSKKIFRLCIGEDRYNLLSDLNDYINNFGEYVSYLSDYGMFVFEKNSPDGPVFWFAVDDKGMLYFCYAEQLKSKKSINRIYNSPIAEGERIIKEAINKRVNAFSI